MSPFMYVMFGVIIGWILSTVTDSVMLLIKKRKQKKKDKLVYNEEKDIIEDKDLDK